VSTGIDRLPSLKAAAVQAAAVIFDRDRTIDKLESLTAEAASNGADVVVFSESYIPGFPVWNLLLAPVDQHELFTRFARNAMTVPGRHVDRLRAIARRHEVILSVGVTERSEVSAGCLWNANLLFGRDGALLNHRRKLVPTWAEKLTWASGDAHGLEAVDTDAGRIGVLICGENTNTLARFALLAEGEQLHLATYPPAWPTRRATTSTPGYDLARAVEIRSAAHAFEGKLFSVVSSGVLDDESIRLVEKVDPEAAETLRNAPKPASMIVGPAGTTIAEPIVGEEGIVYAEVDLADSIEHKQIHDIVGYYQRFELFNLTVDRRRPRPITATDELPERSPRRYVAMEQSEGYDVVAADGAKAVEEDL
jgi:nitrilase